MYAAIVAASLSLASCGLGTIGNATNTNANATAPGNLLTGSLQQTGTGLLGNLLSSILGNTTSQQSLVGTWVYSGPKVVFESDSAISFPSMDSVPASQPLRSTTTILACLQLVRSPTMALMFTTPTHIR